MMHFFIISCLMLQAYLIGSIPFGMISAKLFVLPDPRTYGSKNIGATNVLRTGNKAAAAFTLLGDALKGVAAIYVAQACVTILALAPSTIWYAAFFAFLGHTHSIFLNFTGGKGVAVAAGILAILVPYLALIAVSSWLIVCLLTGYSSLAAIFAAVMVIAYSFFFIPFGTAKIMLLLISCMLLYKHRANIVRLSAGREASSF